MVPRFLAQRPENPVTAAEALRSGGTVWHLIIIAAAPLLPVSKGPFNPAQVELAGKGPVHSAELRDVQTCGGCHADAVAQWRSSAHAFASFNNPLYRPSVELLRYERGKKPSRMCAACHDLALLTAGVMDRAVLPTNDPRAHAAITCQTCHGIVGTRPDGNGSFTLVTSPIPLPSEKDPGSLEAHRARVAGAALRTAGLCGSCHRSFLDATTGNASAFSGVDDFTPWAASAYAGATAARLDDELPLQDCRGCHMPREPAPGGDASAKDGLIASHRFLGGHTYLAAMLGDAEQLERQQKFLTGVASVDVAPGATLTGPEITFDVVLRNLSVGHRFPGGALDAQDTRLEVVVRSAAGVELTRDDGYSLHAEVLDAKGAPVQLRETHHFASLAYDRTLEPRGVRVVRYRLSLPERAATPVQVTARLLHRSRNAALALEACKESKMLRSLDFAAAAKRFNGVVLDACVAQPVTEVASSSGAAGPLWQRRYFHGLALGDRAVLEAALREAPAGRPRAQVLGALAELDGRDGKIADALEKLGRVETLVPGHPFVDRARGQVLMIASRAAEASEAFAAGAKKVPGDVEAWRLLARALLVAGKGDEALVAAQSGLRLMPRDSELLALQAEVLAADASAAASAKQWRLPVAPRESLQVRTMP